MSKTESWQIEPKHEQVCPALLCISKLNVKVNKEGTYVFGGATYGFYCTYDSGDYTFRFFFGRTLGGFGKQLHFELYFKGEIKKKREIPLKTFMAEIFKQISIAANAIECNNSMEYFSSQRK